jgi:hypothetical protein
MIHCSMARRLLITLAAITPLSTIAGCSRAPKQPPAMPAGQTPAQIAKQPKTQVMSSPAEIDVSNGPGVMVVAAKGGVRIVGLDGKPDAFVAMDSQSATVASGNRGRFVIADAAGQRLTITDGVKCLVVVVNAQPEEVSVSGPLPVVVAPESFALINGERLPLTIRRVADGTKTEVVRTGSWPQTFLLSPASWRSGTIGQLKAPLCGS